MTGLFAGVLNSAAGGLAGQIIDLAKAYFPPDMPPEKRAAFEADAARVQAERERNAAAALIAAQAGFDKRVADLEGTAKDLKAIPILGPIMLFLRGSQRPVWGFACMYLDFKVFGGAWALTDPQIAGAFYAINFLVLGFLFGERAIANVAPAIKDIVSANRGK
jgi:hypothetical protein